MTRGAVGAEVLSGFEVGPPVMERVNWGERGRSVRLHRLRD